MDAVVVFKSLERPVAVDGLEGRSCGPLPLTHNTIGLVGTHRPFNVTILGTSDVTANLRAVESTAGCDGVQEQPISG